MAHKKVIVRAARCVGDGGKAVLVGYDSLGTNVFSVPVTTNNVAEWASQPDRRADLARVKKEYDQWHEAAAVEAAAT